MTRRCIFGCERAGSGEHVFPATLGGRRVNKGILCAKHNNDLAPLAGVLSDQLRFLNAQIGVRPDHNKTNPHASILTGSDGREYVFSVDDFRVKGGHFVSEETMANGSTSITMEFGTQEEIDRWIAAQAELGNQIKVISRTEGARLNHGILRSQITLGGADGLRAVGYVALTFLAHRFPDLARSVDLQPFRQFVLGNGHVNDFVWWLDPPSASEGDPYEFGHKVEIAVPMSGDAVARVTFFSSIAFGVRFGPVAYAKAETRTTHINPLADHPPDDVLEYAVDSFDIDLKLPEPQAETLREAIASGSAERAFKAFMQRVIDYRLREDMRPVHARLTEAQKFASVERRAFVDRVVEENAQRVLNLIRYVADDLRSQRAPVSAASRTIIIYLDSFFPEGTEPSPAFERASESIQTAARRAIAEKIDTELEQGVLDLDRLCMLLGGGPGAHLVGLAVMKPLLDVLD